MNRPLLRQFEALAARRLPALLERILTWAAGHGTFGMATVDTLHDRLPATVCANCGRCCQSISFVSLEAIRLLRDLMASRPPGEIAGLLGRALRPGGRMVTVGGERRLRCAFRDEATQRCLVHPVRPFPCRLFGLWKATPAHPRGERECNEVREVHPLARPLAEDDLVALQAPLLENSESLAPFPGRPPIAFFPLEYWLWRAALGPEKAGQFYREVLVPASTPLTRLWRSHDPAPDPTGA